MTFQVLARKWRPQKFAELIGQEHIVRTLTNSIKLDRLSHAYVFSGTRGVGKTTSARIFAKALNCEKGPSAEPCDVCRFCEEIRDGRCVDVQEIDGASNTGVAEVRDIIDNVRYAPSACRYKIYIIDEVHMLSRSAFNALLKTLEEPPPGVVFLFATTESHKIPETILSRCQCFEFKPLSQKQIVKQMEIICAHEKVKIDARSLEEIARNGAGSMRDAQSLLDQVLAYCGREVGPGDVEAVLGIVGGKTLETFIGRVRARDAAGLLALVQETADAGKDLHFFCRDLADYVRCLMISAVAKNPDTLLDAAVTDTAALKRQSGEFSSDELHQMFNVLIRAEGEMKRSTLPRHVFEMAILRLTDVRPFRDLAGLIAAVDRAAASTPSATPAAPAPANAEAKKKLNSEPPQREETPPKAPPPSPATAPSSATDAGVWARICDAATKSKPQFEHYLQHCRVLTLSTTLLHLEFADPYTLNLVGREDNQKALRSAVAEVCGSAAEIKLTLADGNGKNSSSADKSTENETAPVYNASKAKADSRKESEIIQDALDIFGGIVIR